MSDTLESLNAAYGIPDLLRFEAGEGGLTRAVVSSPDCEGSVYLHGAHVATWRPAEHQEVLWMSKSAVFADGQPIRGGVPVCFPWFGPKQDNPDAPSHGLARTRAWDVAGAMPTTDGVCLFLAAAVDLWECTMTVGFGRQLVTSLRVRNVGGAPASFEAALHTYFTVGDIHQVRITGLEGARYRDQLDGVVKTQDGQPIAFCGETDRLYLDTEGAVTLHDPALGRRIRVEKQGSRSLVVWNPWIDKSKRMADMDDDGWPSMVCIETANARDNVVTVEPGGWHEMSATVVVEP